METIPTQDNDPSRIKKDIRNNIEKTVRIFADEIGSRVRADTCRQTPWKRHQATSGPS
ncbi:MAG: hypothetical protein GXP46_03240 [Deferribacteres bacterium]|nr:hypothetical protein [Deferribacteres bacterium]